MGWLAPVTQQPWKITAGGLRGLSVAEIRPDCRIPHAAPTSPSPSPDGRPCGAAPRPLPAVPSADPPSSIPTALEMVLFPTEVWGPGGLDLPDVPHGAAGRGDPGMCSAAPARCWRSPAPIVPSHGLWMAALPGLAPGSPTCRHTRIPVSPALPGELFSRRFGTRASSSLSSPLSFWRREIDFYDYYLISPLSPGCKHGAGVRLGRPSVPRQRTALFTLR